MRAALAADGDSSADLLAADSGASVDIDTDNGVTLGPEQSSIYQDDIFATSSGGFYFTTPSAEPESDQYSASEDDAEMSSDGGVQITMTASEAEELNAEMDMVDAEVMGTFNLAAIATNTAFTLDDDMEDWGQYELDDDVSHFDSDLALWTGAQPDDGIAHQEGHLSNLPNAMSEVSQQLLHIQNGQEQGELAASAMQHASTQDHSTGPVPSNPFTFPILWSPPVLNTHQPSPTSSFHFDGLGDVTVQTSSQVESVETLGDDDDDMEDVGDDFNESGIIEANSFQVEDQHNLSLGDFLYSWGVAATRSTSKKRRRGPHLGCLSELRESRLPEVRYSDLRGLECDFQGIDWKKLEVSRKEARRKRLATYKNYTNFKVPHWHALTLRRGMIDNSENYFKFRRMDFKHKINLAHFQLRNLLACTSRNNVFYAGESRVYQTNPVYGQKAVRMNLTNPEVQPTQSPPWTGIQISTLAADHNILLAGGFCGEYALVALDRPGAKHTEGLILDDQNSITNHIQIQLNRHSGLPQAAIASNDCGMRILDCTTNMFVGHHKFDHAINCSALSPDHRLRALVGDTRNVMICNAETGEILQELDGHVDYGFACAWADNGWHVATGNQDKLVKIWDARMWTDSFGTGKPIQTISAMSAGVRSLKFSPLGSGKRVLVAAEPADIVSVIDAESYVSKQTLDFYGEIAGVDFSPDGQELFVGIHDSLRGGIMEFEKCGFGQLYGHEDAYHECHREPDNIDEDSDDMYSGLDWKATMDEVVADPRSKRSATHRRRKPAHLGDMDPF